MKIPKKTSIIFLIVLLVLSSYIVFSALSEAEQASRIQIKYRQANGTLISVSPTVNINPISITRDGVNYNKNISTSLYQVYVRNNSNTAKAVRFEKDGYFFIYDISGSSLDWIGQPGLPSASSTLGGGVPSNSQDSQVVTNGDTITYPNAFSNTNVSYKITPDTLKETFILSSLPSIEPYNYLEYTGHVYFNSSLKICANNVCYIPSGSQDNFNTTGRIEFKDNLNVTRFYLEKPVIKDSSGNITTGIYFVRGSNAQMIFELRIPTSFIQNAVFPIFIDPTVVSQETQTVTFDTNVANVTAVLYKNVSENFNNSVGGVFVRFDNSTWKFGANDSFNTGWEQYKYIISTTANLESYQGNYMIRDGTQGYIINLGDICGKISPIDNSSTDCQYNTYSQNGLNYLEVIFYSDADIDPVITQQTVAGTDFISNVTFEPMASNNWTHLNLTNQGIYAGLVAYYSFDHDDNLTAIDFTNDNYDLTQAGTGNVTSSSNCIYGSCGAFNGANAALKGTSPNGNSWQFPASSSVWFKSGTPPQAGLTQFIYGNRNQIGGIIAGKSLAIIDSTSNITQFSMGTGARATDVISYQIPASDVFNWHHVVIVINRTVGSDASGNYSSWMYFDNVLVNQTNITNIAYVGGTATNGFHIGANLAVGVIGRFFNGSIDEVMIWNATFLNSSDVNSIYLNQSARFAQTGLESTNNTINITGGFNTLNVSVGDVTNLFGTNISLAINYLNSTGWTLTTAQNITTNNLNYTYIISAGTTNITLNWTFMSNANRFYTPILGSSIFINSYNVTYDTTPPNATLLTPSNNSYSNTTTQNFTVNATDDISGLNNSEFYLYNQTGLINQTNSTFTGELSKFFGNTVGSLLDGIFKWFYKFFDRSGNSITTENFTLTIDTIKPLIQFVSNTNASGIYTNSNITHINITFSDTNLGNATIFLYNTTSLISSNTSITSPFFINYVNLSDGIYFYNATVTDLANNKNFTETRNITIDTTYPQISFGVNTLPDGSNVSQSNIYMNTTWTEINPDTITFWAGGISHINSVPPNVYEDGSFTKPDGTYTYYVVICDLAGNCNQTETRTITLDTTRPVFTVIPNNQTINYSQNFNATFTATDTHFNNYKINWTNTFSINSSGYLTNATVLTPATYIINVSANDTFGNTNYTMFSLIVTRATPVINLTINGSSSNISILNGTTISLNVTQTIGDLGATLQIYNNGTLINQGASPIGNNTLFNVTDIVNITAYYLQTQNYTNVSQIFYVNVTSAIAAAISSGGGSSGGSSPSPIISSHIPSEIGGAITLNSMILEYQNGWIFDKLYTIKIYTVDLNNNSVDIDSILVSVPENITIHRNETFRSSVGKYYKDLTVSQTNITSLDVNVTVYQGEKHISQTIRIIFVEPSTLQKVVAEVKSTANNFVDAVFSVAWYVYIIAFVLITVIVFVFFFIELSMHANKARD